MTHPTPTSAAPSPLVGILLIVGVVLAWTSWPFQFYPLASALSDARIAVDTW